MADVQQMGTLLSKMTTAEDSQVTFTSDQVSAVMEVLIPKIATNMPGMPPGMQCAVERSDTGWVIKVDRPS